MKKELIRDIATKLVSYGYTVYLSGNQTYGFYTDGFRVVCFGGHWDWSVDFSGNYKSQNCGTGWVIAKDVSNVTAEEAARYIAACPPHWATKGERVKLITPEQHIAIYGKSSRYAMFDA